MLLSLRIILFIFAITTVGEVKSSTVVEGLVHLAADDATVGEIEDALDEKKFKYRRDTSVEGGFRVDTDKQYKGWTMMMQGDAMLTALGMGVIPAELPGSRVSSSGMAAAGKNIAMNAAKGAEVAAKGGTQAIEQVAVHGNSLKSMRPTWGYKLYSNDGTFLKNGITSKTIPQTRYTKTFMETRYMVPIKQFPNRRAAWNWEYQQNLIQKGPLNKNMH